MDFVKQAVPNHFKEIYSTDKPIILLTGGRGSGKSFQTSLFTKRLTYERNQVILYTRYTMASASISVIPEITEKIELEGDDANFHITKSEVVNKLTDSPILFKGIKTSSGNQTANLKSIQGLSTFVVDEAEEWQSEDDFENLSLSIRSKKAKNRIIIVMNPSNYQHFVYEKYIKDTFRLVEIDGVQVQLSTHPDVLHIHTTYLDNVDNLSDKFLREVQEIKLKNFEKYAHKVIGKWNTGGDNLVFTQWEEYSGKEPADFYTIYGIDWGYIDPFTVVQVAYSWKYKTMYVKELVYKSGLTPDDCLNWANEVCDKSTLTVADSANPANINQFLNDGWNIYGALKEKVTIGIEKLKDWRILIHKDSTNAKKEFMNYSWNPRKPLEPIDDHNHCFVGETIVTTNKGGVMIKNINKGDKVLTSNGFKKVLHRFDNGVKKVTEYLLHFDTFKLSLVCTPDHRVKTLNGWKKISELTEGETIYQHSISTGKITGFTKENTIIQEAQNDFIEWFGSSTMVKFLMGIISTIKTGISQTTALKTLTVLVGVYTYILKLRKGLKTILSGLNLFTKKELKPLNHGTHHQRGTNGTRNKQEKQDLDTKLLVLNNAKSVLRNTQLKGSHKNSAQTTVNLNTGDLTNWMTSLNNAVSVNQISQSTNIQKQKLVQISAGLSYQQEVYDLMVEGKHEYFANGLLVHNCIDPLRYIEREIRRNYIG